ncbi:hypothetical protein Vafri_10339, partial [Volvox africanus]
GLDPEMEDAEVPPLPKRMRTMPAVTVPVAAAAVSDPNPAALGGPSASRRMRVGPPGKRLSIAEYRERQALGACFGWGSTDHQWRLCPENPNAKKGLKASGGVVKHKGSKGPKYWNKGQGKGKGNNALEVTQKCAAGPSFGSVLSVSNVISVRSVRTVLPSVLAEVEHLVGRRFSLDA